MSKRSYLRYLNPNSGKYEAPMLEDVGDIAELKTVIKTNLVAAINYLYENGISTEVINGKLSQIETLLGQFSRGQWTDEQLQSLIGHVNTIVEIPLTEFQQGIDDQKALWDTEVQQKLDNAKVDYNNRLEQTERVLTDAGNQLDSSRLTLEQATSELNNMTLNVAGYEERFNEIDNSLKTVVYENKFDLMTSEFIQNKLVRIETAEGVIEESIARILSAVDGRVAQTESDYVNLTGELSKRISFQELKGELDKYQLDKYGDNLLEGTRDYRGWVLNGVIPSAGTDYRQTKTVAFLSSGQQIESTVTGLKVGETYSVSVSMYYEGAEVLPTPVLRTDGNNYSLTEIYEDTRQFDNWIRVYTHFVAMAEEQSVAFFVSGIPLGKEVKLAGLKIEYDKVTPWKPHIEDTWYELELFDSKFIQQANAITTWLRHIAEDEDGLLDEEALWQVTAEGLLGQARTAKKLEDGTYQQEAANLTLNSSEFSTKVGKTVSDGIESINFDNRNRVINSNFQFNFEQWENVNPAFTLEKVGDHNYATVSRSGLTANNPVVLKTNKFKVTDLETLAIGLSVLTPNLSAIDVDTVMRLEIFDINDIRVALQDFTLSSMTGSVVNNEPSRLITKYKINNNLAAKGQITLQLPRNGKIGFSQLSIQNSDINVTDWAPAPEDIMMIQLRMDSWIEQDAESVAIGAIRQEIEKGKEDDTSAFHEMWAQIKVTADNFELAVKKDGIVQSINGSSEGLKIDFEKVNITGELLASLISVSYLDVSKGFRIMNGNFPILQINNLGEAEFNISKLNINTIPSIIEDRINDIELTPGPKGEDGVAGKDGVGIKSTVIHYGKSTSGTSHSGVAWTTAIPSVPNGQFLWTRTTWTYDDNTTETGYSVAKMGETGATGPQGVSITKVDVQYYLSTSNTSLVGGSWSTTAPAWVDGRFMWSKTVTTYTSGSPSESTPVCITGAKGSTGSTGSTGATGRGVSSITEEYYLSDSKTSQVGGSWTETAPTWSTGKYMWTRSKIVWSNPTSTTYSTPIVDTAWEAVNELEVGGTNLVDGSPSEWQSRGFIVGDWMQDLTSTIPISSMGLKAGDTVTLSIELEAGSRAVSSRIEFFKNNSERNSAGGNTIQNRTGVSSLTATIPADRPYIIIRLQPDVAPVVTAYTVKYRRYKLEKGNKATDWSMSKNDYIKHVQDAQTDGQNYFHKSTQLMALTNMSQLGRDENTAPNGFTATGASAGPRSFRLNNVINSNGWWTISGWFRGSQSTDIHFQMDINDGPQSNAFYAGTANAWQYFEYTAYVSNYSSTYNFIDFNVSHWAYYFFKDVMVNKGDKAISWRPAPEDVQSNIDLKADNSETEAALNEAAAKLQVLQQEIEAAATSNELKDFIDRYNKDMASRDKDARESESSLSSALASINSIQTNMGDMSATWQFIDRFIKNTPQGIVVGNDSSGSYILIKEDRLAFYSNGQEVAFISQNLMEISRGAFVEQIQIAKYQFEESTTNHLTIRYVG